MAKSVKVVLKDVRISFVNVFKARAIAEGQDPKYNLQILMDKKHPQLKEVQKAIFEAAKEKFGDKIKGDKLPAWCKSPLRDGNERLEENEALTEYDGMFFMNANSARKPQVLDRRKNEVIEEDGIIYSGCYANLSLNFYGFEVSGNKGVAVGLNAVQFLRDGEPLGGIGNAANDFDELEDEDYDI